jgi:hypothetical protein
MNIPVRFPIAKLLKEKWFKEKCKEYFTDGTLSISDEPKEVFMEAVKHNKVISCLAPTIADVVMWFYEKHGIWIEVTTDVFGKFCWIVKSKRASNNNFNSPTEAYEAAIEYALNNFEFIQTEPNQKTLEEIRNQEISEDYYPPKDLANAIWGSCFQYEDIENNNIREKVKNACFLIEKIYKIQELCTAD